MWVSDNGATNHVTSDPRFVYDSVEIPPGQDKVLIGDEKEMNVIGIRSLNLKLHSKTDFNEKLTIVDVTEDIQYKLFYFFPYTRPKGVRDLSWTRMVCTCSITV